MADKILIVDDDIETVRLVGLMLKRKGYETITANNGAQAIELAVSQKPALIVLDIMMPDMDGYQVTVLLRNNPITADIPILMFTAKGQVDDKVTGYEAGADDYLTKPVHPAELIAHIKSLLGRRAPQAEAQIAPTSQGYILGVVAPTGGMGASTVALNLAIALQKKSKKEIIAAEVRPGHGSWGIDLGYTDPESLSTLLRLEPAAITTAAVQNELMQTTYAIKLLMASPNISEITLSPKSEQMLAILHQLPLIADIVVLDIGTTMLPYYEKIIQFCNELIMVVEPYPASTKRARLLMTELAKTNAGKNKPLNVVISNRVRANMQLTAADVNERIGQAVKIVIPPAPEMAYQAATRFIPLSQVQPDDLIAQQFKRLAETILQNIKNAS
ncbi:MAG: response regulator [Anaerolineaceae bacterium]|jgi:DNA-binding response OmpR family regulator|nr:response regulator [Anaerolineaceae bacterium]